MISVGRNLTISSSTEFNIITVAAIAAAAAATTTTTTTTNNNNKYRFWVRPPKNPLDARSTLRVVAMFLTADLQYVMCGIFMTYLRTKFLMFSPEQFIGYSRQAQSYWTRLQSRHVF